MNVSFYPYFLYLDFFDDFLFEMCMFLICGLDFDELRTICNAFDM